MQKALITGALAAIIFLGFFVPTFVVVSQGLINQASAISASVNQSVTFPPVHRAVVTTNSSSTVSQSPANNTVVIAGKKFTADIAADPASRELGLSFRPNLPANTVKLFVFPAASNWGFWMKDMNFPLDIIWLNATGTVVYLEKNLATSTYPDSFGPPVGSSALYVIEANAGTAAKLGVNVGSSITLPANLIAQ